jgi:O-antigen/teichoic acid export membrane protein
MSIAYGGLISFAFRGMNLVVAFTTVFLTSNALAKESYGAFALGLAVVGFVNAMTGGLTASTAYQVSNQRRPPGMALVNGLVAAMAAGAVGVAIGSSLALSVEGTAGRLAIPVAFAAAAVVLNGAIAGVFLGQDRLARYNVALVAAPLASLAAVSIVVFAFDMRTPQAALGGYAAGQWGATCVLLALGGRRLATGAGFDGALVRTMARFAGLAAVSSGLSFLNYRADLFVVERFEGKEAVATYSLAVYLAESVWQVSGSLALATYPRLAALDRAAAAELTARVMRHTVVLLAVVCAALFTLADVIQEAVFPKYEGMATAMRIILPGILIYGLAQSFSGFYTYQRGKPWASAFVALAGLVIDLSLAVVLLPAMGINGAALASALAYSGAMTGALAVFLRSERLPAGRLFRFGRQEIEDYRAFLGRVGVALGRGRAASINT